MMMMWSQEEIQSDTEEYKRHMNFAGRTGCG